MNTEDSKTRNDALNKIIEKMNSSLFYEPIKSKKTMIFLLFIA